MLTLFALSDAEEYTITAVAIWFVLFPLLVTALIAFAFAGVARERTENAEEQARRRRGSHRPRTAARDPSRRVTCATSDHRRSRARAERVRQTRSAISSS